MSQIITADNGILMTDSNGLITGGSVVVLDRIPSVKKPIESKFHKEFSGEGVGGAVKRMKGNLIGLPNSKRSTELEGMNIRPSLSNSVRPSSSASVGSGIAKNSIKFPSSLKAKKEVRNNIKLVL